MDTKFLEALATVILPIVMTSLMGIITYKIEYRDKKKEKELERAEALRKEEADRFEQFRKEEKELHEELKRMIRENTERTFLNAEASKDVLRYMLTRYHAEYMIQGYITSHQLDVFSELYNTYHVLGGNGTVTHLFEEVSNLPVRNDCPSVSPYQKVLQMANDKKEG